MTIKTEAAALTRALGHGEHGLADMVHELSPAQKERVAEFVRKYEFLPAAQALYVNPAELEQLLLDTGHVQCAECEEWFPADEVLVSGPEPADDEIAADEVPESVVRCLDCNEEFS